MKNEELGLKNLSRRGASLRLWLRFCLVTCAFYVRAPGQQLIDWSKVAAGSGTSTVGQPDTGGAMTNGLYSVTGGFRALPIAVQVVGCSDTPDEPRSAKNALSSQRPQYVVFSSDDKHRRLFLLHPLQEAAPR